MDLGLLTGLSVLIGLIAASVSIACLIRLEDLHRELQTGRPRGRRTGTLRGRGKVLRLYDGPPPRR